LLARAGRAASVGSNSGAHSAILRGGDASSIELQHYSAALVIGCKPSSSFGGS
jgi:hypothetical protein